MVVRGSFFSSSAYGTDSYATTHCLKLSKPTWVPASSLIQVILGLVFKLPMNAIKPHYVVVYSQCFHISLADVKLASKVEYLHHIPLRILSHTL
jgi:hypothetical protein